LKLDNYSIIHQDSRQVIYKLKNFSLKNNATIFTNTYFLGELFSLLKKVDSKFNLTIVTNQTDHLLDYDFYKRKPKCVKYWYSINLQHVHENLNPIPLGLSNNYSPKNLLPEDFDRFSSEVIKKENKMYINFNSSTNFSERENLYKKFESQNWVKIQNSNLSKKDYYKELSKFKFSLSPWGNGIDTHRVWESLYVGTIPITKYHHTFSTSQDLPILFVDDYDQISEELLLKYLENYKLNKFNLMKLNNSYWSELINSHKSDNYNYSLHIKASSIFSNIYTSRYKFKQLVNRYIKIFIYYLKKLKKLISLEGK